MKLINALSGSMFSLPATVTLTELSLESAARLAQKAHEFGSLQSFVGHADTAALFERELGVPVEVRRERCLLLCDDLALLGQYSGPRLPEGATELPEGATIRWIAARVGE